MTAYDPGEVELEVPQDHGVDGGRGLGRDLLGVHPDQAEDEPAVHDAEKVVEEKCQTGVEVFH